MNEITIVGFGLAGASLAWSCHFKSVDFKIVDSDEEASSHVAAGLINPVVFKRLTKSWNADQLMPFARDFYQKIETVLGRPILSHKSILRVFSSIEEQNNWSALEGDERFKEFVNPSKSFMSEVVDAPLGVGEIKTLGHLNTREFLSFSLLFFKSKGINILKEKMDFTKLKDNECYVFCEGSAVLQNPFFNYLPLRPTHGDIITIKSSSLKIEHIINKNLFVLPLGDNLYKIGATYNWELKSPQPSELGKLELLERLRSFTSFDFEVLRHEAGLRPTVSDRRPLLGEHPKYKNLAIFNGLGTKGVMIAPFYANHLLNHLFNHTELDQEVSIKRHLKHYNA